MDQIIVMKFGGSSVADNEKLDIVSKKIIDIYKNYKKIVVVVSAQGKTTDTLINEAKQLAKTPNSRELDMLLSIGEQITASKLSILLNNLGYNSISLTGWQAGIYTDKLNQNAKILNINTSRINKELNKNKIVVVTGFQGINENNDITTLGRGGSDTTAVALAAALKAKECYIYSDVDGIYTADPNKIDNAKKLKDISYDEMLEISSEGAKVLHNRCVNVGQKYDIPIIAKSTFNNNEGTTIKNNMEDSSIKSIVKNDNISRISIIGNGIINNKNVLRKIINVIDKEEIKMINIEITSSKIAIIFNSKVSDEVLLRIHNELID